MKAHTIGEARSIIKGLQEQGFPIGPETPAKDYGPKYEIDLPIGGGVKVDLRIHPPRNQRGIPATDDMPVDNFRIGIQLFKPVLETVWETLPDGSVRWTPHPDEWGITKAVDDLLVRLLYDPPQNPKFFGIDPQGWEGKFLDPAGFGYFDALGKLTGRTADEGHIHPSP